MRKRLWLASADVPDRSERYSRFARVLISGQAVCEQMADRPRRARPIPGEAIPPTSAVESELLQIWEKVLQLEGLGVEDDFFALGGTSLVSVELFAQIERRLDVKLRLTAILDAPTVRSLAHLLEDSAVRERSGVVCLRRGGSQNLFLVHDGLGETLLYLNLARRLPKTMAVYGIEPKRLPGIPLAHASIEADGCILRRPNPQDSAARALFTGRNVRGRRHSVSNGCLPYERGRARPDGRNP